MKARIAGLIFSLFVGAIVAGEAAAQTRSTISVNVDRFADLGSSGYLLRLSGLRIDFANLQSSATATAPDGTLFDASASFISSLSLDQIVARFAGEWTISDTRANLPGTPVQIHHFNVAASDLTNFPTAIPAITSPPNGAFLPAVFQYTSTGGGITLRNSNFSYAGTGNRVDLSQFGSLPQVVEARTAIGTGNARGTATSVESSPARLFSYVVQTFNQSPPVQWTVGVPEPAALSMAGTGLFTLAAVRRRK